ncbi:MAG: SatD family protein [Defluviitaleaceae bacterium]|nr:SatD family protein [Defluviitaleaceae bacterium]
MPKQAARRNKAVYCVIVGDIVNSRGLEPDIREKVTQAAQGIFDRINTDYIGSIMAEFGMVRGDAFEGVMLTQYYAPQIVQDIIKAIYRVAKTKVRISVALGQLTVTDGDRNKTDGPAFHTAFDNLEKLKERQSEHWLQVSFDIGPLAQPLVDSNLALLTALTEGWTDKQREVAWAVEAHGGRHAVASRFLDIPSSVVNKQINAANYNAYKQAWDGLTDYLVNMDEYVTRSIPVSEKSYVPYFNIAQHKLDKKADVEDALPFLKESLKLAKQDLDANDPLLIPILNKLALTYSLLGKNNDAHKAVHESLQLQAAMPKIRIQYAETLYIKARLEYDSNDFLSASGLYQDALDIAHSILDDSHPLFGDIYSDYAILFRDMGEYEKALKYCHVALSIEKDNIYVPPVSYANTLLNTANCYYAAGDYKQALAFAEESIGLYQDNLPSNHIQIAHAQSVLSSIKKQQKGDRQ